MRDDYVAAVQAASDVFEITYSLALQKDARLIKERAKKENRLNPSIPAATITCRHCSVVFQSAAPDRPPVLCAKCRDKRNDASAGTRAAIRAEQREAARLLALERGRRERLG